MKIKDAKKMIVAIGICFALAGCGNREQIDSLKQEISGLQATKQSLESEISKLEDKISRKKEENGITKYVLTLKIKQSHFSLDISEHMKDSMNAMEIQIPVDREYYDSVEVGQNIADEFRMGSFVFRGTIGNFKVTVAEKEIQ